MPARSLRSVSWMTPEEAQVALPKSSSVARLDFGLRLQRASCRIGFAAKEDSVRTYRSARPWHLGAVVIGCLALAASAAASGTALPNACTVLTKAHPEKAFGHGKILTVSHRKSQKFGVG